MTAKQAIIGIKAIVPMLIKVFEDPYREGIG